MLPSVDGTGPFQSLCFSCRCWSPKRPCIWISTLGWTGLVIGKMVGKTSWDGGPLNNQPIYTLYHVGIYWVYHHFPYDFVNSLVGFWRLFGWRFRASSILLVHTWILKVVWCAITKHFERELKWRSPHLYKLYGYGLCKGKPIPKIAENKVQYLHFRYLKLLVIRYYTPGSSNIAGWNMGPDWRCISY